MNKRISRESMKEIDIKACPKKISKNLKKIKEIIVKLKNQHMSFSFFVFII